MNKIKINKRENILQESGDYLFKFDLTVSKKLAPNLPYSSIDCTIEFLNNGDVKDVNNIDPESYREFMMPKIFNELGRKEFEINYMLQQQIIT